MGQPPNPWPPTHGQLWASISSDSVDELADGVEHIGGAGDRPSTQPDPTQSDPTHGSTPNPWTTLGVHILRLSR